MQGYNPDGLQNLRTSELQNLRTSEPQNLKTSKPQNLILVKTDILFCSCKKKSVYLLRKTIENRDCIG